jgi:hypothetical protein
MTSQSKLLESVFIAPGIIELSAAALEYARDFANAIVGIQGGNHVVTFDWSQSVTVRPTPDAPWNDIADCLMLAAYERNDVPPGFVQNVDGAEFAIRMPVEVLNASTKRLIDIDESLLFKLALR